MLHFNFEINYYGGGNMKVILKQDVKSLGKREQLVEVNDGYARNYLLPRGIAVEADAKNLNIMQSRNNAAKEKKDREFAKAQAIAAKLKGAVIEIKAKAGDNGKLFGSITSMDIADGIKKAAGMEIDKKKIDLSEPIKQLGKTEVDIRLYPGVTGRINVNVVKE